MGVTLEAVSRWEKGRKGMRLLAERFLRLHSAQELGIQCPSLEFVGIAPPEDLSISLEWTGEDWVAVA